MSDKAKLGRGFVPLFYKEKLIIINPYNLVGIVTLWSNPQKIFKKLVEYGVNIKEIVAVMGTLYGNGLPELMRNLLYNPQIRYLVICGKNKSGSKEDLLAFFNEGVEELTNSASVYIYKGQLIPPVKIKGRNRIIDGLLRPEEFVSPPKLIDININDKEETVKVFKHIQSEIKQLSKEKIFSIERKLIPKPEIIPSEFPCNPRSFVIVKEDIKSAWEELIFILHRFGKKVTLRKGRRKELQNLKVVIEKPNPQIDKRLEEYGFNVEDILQYQKKFLDPEKPEDFSYTYGNRLRSYFNKDCLEYVVKRLKEDPEDRKCYISLWDTYNDLYFSSFKKSSPCLVSLFFRKFEGLLTMTAVFRTHNALDAWIFNVYALADLLYNVASKLDWKPGSLTVMSMSISIDVTQLQRAEMVVKKSRHFSINFDSNGYFIISIDKKEGKIVVKHFSPDDGLLKIYKSHKAEHLQYQLVRDMAISDIGHAIYMGRQLAKAEIALSQGIDFVQE